MYVDHVRATRAVEQRGERLNEDAANHRSVLPDVQLLEKPLVDLSSDLVRSAPVGRLTLLGGLERFQRGLLDVRRGGLGTPDFAIGFGELARVPLHLSRQQLLRGGAGVVRAQELLAFVLGLLFLSSSSLQVVAGFALLLGQLAADSFLDVSTERRGEAEPQVERLNGFLNALDSHSWTGAVRLLRLFLRQQ